MDNSYQRYRVLLLYFLTGKMRYSNIPPGITFRKHLTISKKILCLRIKKKWISVKWEKNKFNDNTNRLNSKREQGSISESQSYSEIFLEKTFLNLSKKRYLINN